MSGLLGRMAVSAVALVLLSACSTTTDVTGSAGQALEPDDAGAQVQVEMPPVEPVDSPAVLECPSSDLSAQERAGGLPALTLPCLADGSPVNLAGLRGTPTVLNIWASWCPPCTEELPALAEFSKEYGDRVQVLGIDLLDSGPAAAAALADLGVEMATLADPSGKVKADLGVIGPPVSLFVSADGLVAHRVDGPLPEPRMWAELADEHLLGGAER